jgi:hypothetical protein
MTLSGSAGTISQPNLHGPRTGQVWDVHSVTVTGFTAGTVTAYLNSTAGDTVLVFSTPGVYQMGKAQLILQASDYLVFGATSITGTVTVQVAGVELARDLLGEYLI